jgi:hypothetical protein
MPAKEADSSDANGVDSITAARCARGWSQEELAVKLQLLGWDISCSGVGKIEAQIARVIDQRLTGWVIAFRMCASGAESFNTIRPS